jgi:predicted RNase H-like nuclease
MLRSPLQHKRHGAARKQQAAYHSLMPNIAGVDGCPSGWIAIVEQTENHTITAHVFHTFSDLTTALDAAVIAIDIPIGLTDRGPRQCDLDARRHLGPKRGTSVFPAPVRSALSAWTYAEANAASIAAQKKGIPKQAWAIYPKIRQVDEALHADPALRDRVFEVHPELTFSTWSGAPIIPPKRRREGHAIRRNLIDNHFGPLAFESARNQVQPRHASNDDIADAFAALWTAQRIVKGNSKTMPVDPPLDSAGLPMRMVH